MKPVSKATRPTEIKVSRARRFMVHEGSNRILPEALPFQVAMGLGGICKTVRFIDAYLERSGLDPFEHVVGPP